jgi:hypothetical protein
VNAGEAVEDDAPVAFATEAYPFSDADFAASVFVRTERGMKERTVDRLTMAGRAAGEADGTEAEVDAPAKPGADWMIGVSIALSIILSTSSLCGFSLCRSLVAFVARRICRSYV